MKPEKFEIFEEIIARGLRLVFQEKHRGVDMIDVSEYALKVRQSVAYYRKIRRVSEYMSIYPSQSTIVRLWFEKFYDLSIRAGTPDFRLEDELLSFENARWIGEGENQITKDEFIEFVSRASQIKQPAQPIFQTY